MIVPGAKPLTFVVKGSHVFPGSGTFTMLVSVRDRQGKTVTSQSTVTVTPPTAAMDGPRVVSVVRHGIHWQPTVLVVTFNQALDPSSATNPANYLIITSEDDPGGRRLVPVASATYDPSRRQVTLLLASRVNFHYPYLLIVLGTGPHPVKGASGLALDGNMSGKPGSDFQTFVTIRNLQPSLGYPGGPLARSIGAPWPLIASRNAWRGPWQTVGQRT